MVGRVRWEVRRGECGPRMMEGNGATRVLRVCLMGCNEPPLLLKLRDQFHYHSSLQIRLLFSYRRTYVQQEKARRNIILKCVRERGSVVSRGLGDRGMPAWNSIRLHWRSVAAKTQVMAVLNGME